MRLFSDHSEDDHRFRRNEVQRWFRLEGLAAWRWFRDLGMRHAGSDDRRPV